MIYSYGVTQIGSYHIEKNIVCQDAHYIKKLSDSCIIAAVADGLGSEQYSDIASKVAAQTSVELCAEKFQPGLENDAVAELMAYAFRVSQFKIEEIARGNGHEITQYDTTLDLVIFTCGRLYYGHAGDSGIVALLTDGTFKAVTHQKRDEQGRVFPLCFEDSWEFGMCKVAVAAVLLATDGMLETLFPALLRNRPVCIYTGLARAFMDAERLGFEELGEDGVTEKMTQFIAGIPSEKVDDDKTMVVLCDSEVELTPQPEEYYAVPDWKQLKKESHEEYMRAAYPHLYQCKEEEPPKEMDPPALDEKAVQVDPKELGFSGGMQIETDSESEATAESGEVPTSVENVEVPKEQLPRNALARKLYKLGKRRMIF